MGFDWVWFLSVWQTGPAGQRVSRTNAEWRREFQETLPDLREEDIPGSGFAITGYTVHERLGGDAALGRLRERLRTRGLRLLLDFVPNHTGPDHPWVEQHPEYLRRGHRGRTCARAAELHADPRERRETVCSPTGATRTSRAGRTRCSSTTPIRTRRRRCSGSS